MLHDKTVRTGDIHVLTCAICIAGCNNYYNYTASNNMPLHDRIVMATDSICL